MSDYRTIQIDLDVHKLIEAERRSFDEPSLTALRRLLGLPEKLPTTPPGPSSISPEGGRPWSSKGVVLPHGTHLRMSYNGRTHTGKIIDGKWHVEGNVYSSPSGAASDVAITKRGTKTSLDGWEYWEVKRPTDAHWVRLLELMPKALEELGRILA